MRSSTGHRQYSRDERIVKLLLPIELIRTMDRLLVDGVGGFTTRNEFVREAIESYILELTHEPAPEEPATLAKPRGKLQLRSIRGAVREQERLPLPVPEPYDFGAILDVADTALPAPPVETMTICCEAKVITEPLFGMHNRDYPSLWAASRLPRYAEGGVVPFEAFCDRVTEEAWTYAASLRQLERELGLKLTALFPTNPEKRQSSAGAFRSFAIGTLGVSDQLVAEGPLFLWRLLGAKQNGASTVVGLTDEGRGLLLALEGLTVAQPHSRDHAERFLGHLRRHAPEDWWGFAHTVKVVAERPNRLELVEAFRAARPMWRESVAATNAQGYVARTREWGLVAPKVVEGRYELTEFGATVAEQEAEA